MKKLCLVIGGSLLLLFFPTCRKDVYSADACFQEDVLPIFVSNCTYSGCHNAANKQSGYDLTNYDGIMSGVKPFHPLQSEIYKVISGKHASMPPEHYTKLSAEKVNTIKIWIEMGAMNNSNCKNCDTTNVSFSGRVKPLLQNWCVGCHNAVSADGNVDLSSYTGAVNSIAGNKLTGSLNHLPGFAPMPKNANKLPQCDIDAIEKWVNAGHPNN
jgi:hypothetical protein